MAGVRVSLFTTCVVDLTEPQVAEAAVRVLEAGGCEVGCSPDQTCCGQPAWNAGRPEEAAAVARTTLAALEAELQDGAELVVVPAGSCATMLRVFWPELFLLVGDETAAARAQEVGARVREFAEFVVTLDLPDLELGRELATAYHHSCHLLRELGVRDAPVDLVGRVHGCRPVEWEAGERCCGFGGLFTVKLPETSVAMAGHKLDTLAASGAELLVGVDQSCLSHLRACAEAREQPVVVRHLAEVLDAGLPS